MVLLMSRWVWYWVVVDLLWLSRSVLSWLGSSWRWWWSVRGNLSGFDNFGRCWCWCLVLLMMLLLLLLLVVMRSGWLRRLMM